MEVTILVDRFGSNRMNAAEPGKLLRGCSCIAVPFAGGLCEVPHFKANVVNVNDLDRHVINLCRVLREQRSELVKWLDGTPYHPDQLAESQDYCKSVERFGETFVRSHFEWACHYFVASWMTRGGKGGTVGEFDTGLSIRWKSGGGDSVVRFRSATEALAEWEKVMQRCTFTTLDAFDFLDECRARDIAENGIYCDPPWPDDGAKYVHQFGRIEQIRLAAHLGTYQRTKIVVRLNDHPLVRELYQEPTWTWRRLEGRTQANKAKAEVLLTRNLCALSERR